MFLLAAAICLRSLSRCSCLSGQHGRCKHEQRQDGREQCPCNMCCRPAAAAKSKPTKQGKGGQTAGTGAAEKVMLLSVNTDSVLQAAAIRLSCTIDAPAVTALTEQHTCGLPSQPLINGPRTKLNSALQWPDGLVAACRKLYDEVFWTCRSRQVKLPQQSTPSPQLQHRSLSPKARLQPRRCPSAVLDSQGLIRRLRPQLLPPMPCSQREPLRLKQAAMMRRLAIQLLTRRQMRRQERQAAGCLRRSLLQRWVFAALCAPAVHRRKGHVM